MARSGGMVAYGWCAMISSGSHLSLVTSQDTTLRHLPLPETSEILVFVPQTVGVVVFGITKISRKFQENFKKNYIPQEGRHLHQHENIICTTK